MKKKKKRVGKKSCKVERSLKKKTLKRASYVSRIIKSGIKSNDTFYLITPQIRFNMIYFSKDKKISNSISNNFFPVPRHSLPVIRDNYHQINIIWYAMNFFILISNVGYIYPKKNWSKIRIDGMLRKEDLIF